MQARLVEFARLLRQNGVRVSPAEIVDATRALALSGVEERASFRAALRSTLVKRASDVPVFDQLFDIYFSGLGKLLDGVAPSLLASLESAGLDEHDLREVAAVLHELLGSMSPLASAALAGDRAAVARLLEAAASEIDFATLVTPAQVGFYGRRILAGAAGGGGGMAHELGAAVEKALRTRGLSPRGLDVVAGQLRTTLDALAEVARRYAELEQRARAEARRRRSLAPSGFSAVNRLDIERMDAAVRRLAERLRARLATRERARRGALHVRRTLRRNMDIGGIPARLAFRRRRPERPDVVVLCDVSDSVRHVSRLMLLFLYTLQGLFTRVRSFVFVSDIGEVTEAFRREKQVERAADLATAGEVVSVFGNSNYGRALRLFHERYRGAVTRRTTVIVIGDGRNNYHEPSAWVLDELRRRARHLLWICPEDRWAWGQGDSEMPLYGSKAERVAVVTSLDDMEELADVLIPRPRRH